MSGIEEGGGNNEQHNNIHAAAPPNDVMEQLAAGAFTTLCNHLRERSDRVQNIDLMAVSGFCRNCLAKWMVIGARNVAHYIRSSSRDLGTSGCLAGDDDEHQQYSSDPPYNNNNWMDDTNENEYDCILLIDTLDSFGYDEAALEVYGCAYSEWKVRHQKEEITEEQLRRYEESRIVHAKHDTNKLEARREKKITAKNVHALPINIMIHLRAYSFLSLCHHLRSHSDRITNIDLMSISGFCRNCLAKWLVLHARTLSSQITTLAMSSCPAVSDSRQQIVESLNMFDYDMAALYVYGCTYITWTERYQTKATEEQLEKYSNSKAIHAIHDDNLLATPRCHDVVRTSSSKAENFTQSTTSNEVQACTINAASRPVNNSLLSDVCCQDVDSLVAVPFQSMNQSSNRILPELPKGGHDIILKVGILTVSDRAYNSTYETGDLSGPAVENTIITLVNQMNNTSSFQEDQQKTIVIQHIERAIVPDDIESIKEVLLHWSGKKSIKDDDESSSSSYYDLVLTTGGTGFSSRDVTPEATNQILDRQCLGLMSWASMELTNTQPLATLSRASAGTSRDTLIVNLPGNPAGAAQVVELLFPLLLYAIKDLQSHK